MFVSIFSARSCRDVIGSNLLSEVHDKVLASRDIAHAEWWHHVRYIFYSV